MPRLHHIIEGDRNQRRLGVRDKSLSNLPFCGQKGARNSLTTAWDEKRNNFWTPRYRNLSEKYLCKRCLKTFHKRRIISE